MLTRYLEQDILEDLRDRMVFVAGPRQVGKTTLARQILDRDHGVYLSWDNREDRRDILAGNWPAGDPLVVLDEFHKYRKWKRHIKGEYDKHGDRLRFLLTGSARMDVYRKGGDSLQGRYHHYRLHPLTVAEIEGTSRPSGLEPGKELELGSNAGRDSIDHLLERSGFPEPFLASSDRARRRWRKERIDRFFREDVRDLEDVRDISSLQLLADALSRRVASPISFNSLREDLEVAHGSVVRWVDILERLYHCFAVRPYSPRGSLRTIKKAPKLYLWDWTSVASPGARFENLVASHLLKLVHHLEDRDGHRARLCYVRDRQGHEIDFLVTVDESPWFAVEVKLSREETGSSLRYLVDRLKIPFAYQAVLNGKKDHVDRGVRCVPAHRLLANLI